MAVGLYSGVSGLALGVGLYKGNSGLWGGSSGLINGFGGSGPFPGASLYLDFLTPPLDSRITFSRGSNATLVDATGKIVYAPANLLLYSQSLATSPWENGIAGTGVTPTVTDNAGVAPDGTTTATRLQLSLGGGTSATDLSRRRQPVTVQAVAHIFSVWIRSTDGTSSYNIHLQDAINATRNITVTGTWTRYDASAVSPGTLSYLSVGLRGGQAPANSNTADLLVWGAQLEPVTYQTTPSTYVATTASAYYGPRFDYDPVTLAPKGLLIEEARTNLLTYSNDVSNAAWPKTNVTVTTAATSSPDGTVNAQRIAATTTAGTVINNSATAVAATSATFSVYVKQGTGATVGNYFGIRNNTTATTLLLATVNLSTGSVVSYINGTTGIALQNAGNGWWRVTATVTSGVTSGDALLCYVGFAGQAATAGDSIYSYGAQLEAGSFATSYIPTVASTVTRSADVATMTGTNFSSWYNQSEGTFVVNLTPTGLPVGASNTRYLEANDGTANNRKPLLFAAPAGTSAAQYRVAGADQAVLTSSAGAFAVGVNLRAATAYAVNDFGASYNGATALTDASGSVSNTATQLTIGYATSGAGSEIYNGHIRTIAYFNTRLPNAQLQTLTAPSLATTLSLSFTNQAYTVGV